jgi:hypothetical protein
MRRIQSPLSRAISRAIASVEVRRLEMSRTLDQGRIAQLLNEQAAKARASPLGENQLLALALEAAANPGEFSAPALDALREPPDDVAQLYLRQAVFEHYQPVAAKAVARAAPDWVARSAGRRVRLDSQLLAGWLQGAADLNAALWDHPALPAEPGFRGLMLACVPALRDRAEQISRAKAGFSPTTYAEAAMA